mmetsp:Transcript_1730/g.6773  ORF Transcript_1730/g.6773 Transcript_1730/m.6773 type:complete len:85 (+) Transcript_1730:2650-2904(+)
MPTLQRDASAPTCMPHKVHRRRGGRFVCSWTFAGDGAAKISKDVGSATCRWHSRRGLAAPLFRVLDIRRGAAIDATIVGIPALR